MFGAWLSERRKRKRLRMQEASQMLARNPATAYYDAHRLAARARFSGDRQGFMHWAAVAAEIARISDNPMDLDTVQAIVEQERRSLSGSR